MRMHPTIWAVLAMALAPTLPAVAGVTVDHDSSTDFTQYHSFTWAQGTPAGNPLNEERIVNAVRAALEAEGLTAAESGGDLTVVTHVATDVQLRVTSDTFGYGGYRGWRGYGRGWGTTYSTIDQVPVGTLIVDLVDAARGQLVWRGMASETIPSNPDKIERLIQKRVEKMFEQYPPESR